MSIRNLGWKWGLAALAILVVVGLSLRFAQPVQAQMGSHVWIDNMPFMPLPPSSLSVSQLGTFDVSVTEGKGSSFAVRLDQIPEKGLPVRIEGPVLADSAAIAVDITSLYVVKGNKVFLLDKKTLKILKTIDLPAAR
jgi:hypothetical protein